MTPEMWTAIIGVGGFSVIIPKLVEGLLAWRTGRAQTEKAQNQSILERLAESEQRSLREAERSQREADWRRALEEYAGLLRLLLVQAGVAMHKVPPWPDREDPKNGGPK
jgi:hypothetical protein